MDIDNVREALLQIKAGVDMLAKGPMDFYLRRLTDCYAALLLLAPYPPGTKVRLTSTPQIDDRRRWGWLCAKDIIKTGAIATVKGVDHDGDEFRYELVFDERPKDSFWFTASWFEKSPLPTEDNRG